MPMKVKEAMMRLRNRQSEKATEQMKLMCFTSLSNKITIIVQLVNH